MKLTPAIIVTSIIVILLSTLVFRIIIVIYPIPLKHTLTNQRFDSYCESFADPNYPIKSLCAIIDKQENKLFYYSVPGGLSGPN